MEKLRMELGEESYDICIGRGLISKCRELINLDRRVLIVTDSGVPSQYARTVADQCQIAEIVTVPMGEESKSMKTVENLLARMLKTNMGRRDLCIAVGGGVVGDLTGFASSLYMRGIDFCNIPTTLLSQLDSSIGGKTAVNFCGVQNVVGSFHQPQAVIIDPEVLSTLSSEQIACGMAEAIKMAAICDEEYFALLEKHCIEDLKTAYEEVILGSLRIKKGVVEKDVHEGGLRKILNFGHTLGHGIESLGGVSHGQAVAYGCMPMTEGSQRERLGRVFGAYGLKTVYNGDIEAALRPVVHDKKASAGAVDAVIVDRIGSCRVERMSLDQFSERVRKEI